MRLVATGKRAMASSKAGALALGLILAAFGAVTAAQTATGTVIRSGLHTFAQRHTARVTVAEVGDSRGASYVLIELRDARDRVVARTAGALRVGEPVQLDWPLSDPLTQLRATVAIVIPTGVASRPSTTFEDVDADSLTAIPKVVCSGPPSGRDSPQAFCPGWEATSFVP
jgi:hypothetical protein